MMNEILLRPGYYLTVECGSQEYEIFKNQTYYNKYICYINRYYYFKDDILYTWHGQGD